MDSDVDTFLCKRCGTFKSSLQEAETITSLAGTPSELFLGTSQGRILHAKQQKGGDYKVHGSVDLHIQFPIAQLEHASALNVLLLVCNGVLHEIELEGFTIVSSRQGVSSFSPNSNPVVDDPFTLQLSIATTGKQILVAQKQGNKLDVVHKINTDFPPVAVAYSRHSVCYSTNNHYNMYNLSTKSSMPLFPIDGTIIRPYICTVDSEEFLLSGMDGLAIFVTGQGMSTRPPMVISSTARCIMYREPFILYLSDNGVGVVNTSASRNNIEELELAKGAVLRFLDGVVFAINDEHIATLKQDSFEDQIEKLMNKKKYEQALAAYEKRISEQSFREELLMDFRLLKSRIGVLYLVDRQFESAAAMLEESQIEPDEIISLFSLDNESESDKKFGSPEHVVFLQEYLLAQRGNHKGNSGKVVDTALLKIMLKQQTLDQVVSIDEFKPDMDSCSDILRLAGHYNLLADLLWNSGDESAAIAMWRELTLGTLKDPAFDTKTVVEHLNLCTDTTLIMSILPWLVSVEAEQCLQVVLKHINGLDVFTLTKIFTGMPQLETYLRALPYDETTANELVKLYVERIRSKDDSVRAQLRDLLFKLGSGLDARLSDLFNSTVFPIEKLIIDSEKNPSTALSSLLEDHHDLDTAELLCARFSDTHPQLGLSLLESYLQSDKSDPKVSERISRLLNALRKYVDGKTVLNRLPKDMPLNQVSDFLSSSIIQQQESQWNDQLRQALLERMEKTEKEQHNASVKITETSKCAVCGRLLSYDEPLSHIITGYVVHSKCIRHPNLCPVTNTVLFYLA